MKCIEIGNCLRDPRNCTESPGIIIEATREEIAAINDNILYNEVEVLRVGADHENISGARYDLEKRRNGMLMKVLAPVLAVKNLDIVEGLPINVNCEQDAVIEECRKAVEEAQRIAKEVGIL